jgi:aspartate/methionine/tyrosine aminotransferase
VLNRKMMYSKQDLLNLKQELESNYNEFKSLGLKLDMSRGKPSGTQLNLSNPILNAMDSYYSEDGSDCRNYGHLEGLPEAKKLFGELLGIAPSQIIIGGNSSLNLMHDTITRLMLFGSQGGTPWCKLDKVKFLCPSPGYDRHFGICENLGIEMILVEMTESGPNMDQVERLVAEDEAIKGIWCVPLYSNPQGLVYSDETVDRLVHMETAAGDFRIFWDNAYGIHHVYEPCAVKNILQAAELANNPNRIYYFFSTSKITFPGSGISLMAAGVDNIKEAARHLSFQTICYDKINQLRTVQFLKSPENIAAHMKSAALQLRPKFDAVLRILDEQLGKTGFAEWIKPKGGYFVSVDTMDGCAKETVRLAKEAGVVLTKAGATFPYGNDPRDRNIRLAPTYPELDELVPAMELFCLCVKIAGVNKLLKA